MKVLTWIVGIVIGGFVFMFALGGILKATENTNPAEANSAASIAHCRKMSNGRMTDLERSTMWRTCASMEEDHASRFGRKP